MKEEIYNVEDVKNEFLQGVIQEYSQNYSRIKLDLAIYMLNDFCNNLIANKLVLLRLDQEIQPPTPPQPVYQQQQQVYQPPQQVYQPPRMQPQNNPFEEDIQEYVDPRTQRMRVDDYNVKKEVAEMNQQLRSPPPRMQPIQQQQIQPMQNNDVNLGLQKDKTFVDKIKEMRSPKKKDNINPDEYA